MRSSKRWLVSALMAVLVLVGVGVGQPPDLKKQTSRGLVPSATLSVDDVVARIMSFDKNKDGKVTRDELPERMQHLIVLGDTNKDGALDKDEIRKLASRAQPASGGFGGRRVAGSFGRGVGVQFGVPGGEGIEGVVDDLKLSGKKKDQARAVVKAHQENVRKLMEQARADMLRQMRQVLSEEEFKDFKAALDRPRGVFRFSVGPAGRPGPETSKGGSIRVEKNRTSEE